MKLLSVDWDFFFPNPNETGEKLTFDQLTLWDWGHNETAFNVSPVLWDIRATAFLKRGRELPGLSGEEWPFWGHFNFHPDARLFVADSHALASNAEVLDGIAEIWSFDAHPDMRQPNGPEEFRNLSRGIVDCGNWLTYAWGVIGADARRVHIRLPGWITKPGWKMDGLSRLADIQPAALGTEAMPTFDRVFVCRSGAWTPTWLDDEFVHFVNQAELPVSTFDIDLADPMTPRDFDLERVRVRARAALEADLWTRAGMPPLDTVVTEGVVIG